MRCFNCGKDIKSAGNRKKLMGYVNVWVHKLCPGTKSYRHIKKNKKEE